MTPLQRLDDQRPLWESFYGVHPLVLVGTLEEDGDHDVAPKHLAMPMSWKRLFGFVCTPRHATWRNAVRTGQFTVSYPTMGQVVQTSLAAAPRVEGKKPALAALPVRRAEVVDGVLVEGCSVQLECELVRVVEELDDNGLIIGRVVAAHVAPELLRGDDRDDAEVLAEHPVLAFLYPDRFATISTTHHFPFPLGFER